MNRSRTPASLIAAVLAAACAASGGSGPASASPDAGTAATAAPTDGVYSEAQAARGRDAFRASCAECHYSSEFRGTQFQFAWGRRSAGDLYGEIMRNMPEDAPGSLDDQVYVDIVAYILQLNGFPAGTAELPPDETVLDAHVLQAPSGGGSRPEAP